MTKVHVTAKADFIQTLAVANPIEALTELIWNGFDADSRLVQVLFEKNELDGFDAIRVRDRGHGIPFGDVQTLFGALGESWKKAKRKSSSGRSLHGKNGKGRFKAFALGEFVQWNSTYRSDGKTFKYSISGKSTSIDDFEVDTPTEAPGAETGTEVRIQNLRRDFRSLVDDAAPIKLAKTFGAYLTEYPDLVLEIAGRRVDPTAVQKRRSEYHLGDVEVSGGSRVPFALSIIEWLNDTDRVLHLCDESGITLHELPMGQQVRAPGFNFTAYVKAELFRQLDASNQLGLAELHPDVQTVLKAVRPKISEHFRLRTLEDQSRIVEKWKQELIYPYDDTPQLNPIEVAERQVFDILAVNVQSYLPSFESADRKAKQFTFRLLAQAVKDNPESIQKIIGEVLGLKKDDQDHLAELLQKTPLASIISSARIVANRLDFLAGLETLLFDKDNRKHLLERDQLHKVLEKESWLFQEEFALAGSEERLDEVLQKHLAKLGKREDDLEPVIVEGGGTGRVDLMLHKATQPRDGEFDYLIVELKRPSQPINSDVLSQIKRYAAAVAGDERFRAVPARWTFMAVSNTFEELAEKEANQRGRPPGMVYDDAQQNITVWAKTWSEIINDARTRLRFVNKHLAYEASRESSTAYLQKTHAKFIPSNGAELSLPERTQ